MTVGVRRELVGKRADLARKFFYVVGIKLPETYDPPRLTSKI